MRARRPAPRRSHDEPAALGLVDVARRSARRGRKGIEPEVATDHTRFPKELLDRRVCRIKTRRDDSVERGRHDDLPALLHEDPHVLLDVERIALGSRDDVLDRDLRVVTEELAREAPGLADVEGLEGQREGIRPTRAPVRATFQEIRPCEAKQEQRGAQMFEDLLEEREQGFLRPVHVLEHDGRRGRAEPRREVARERERDLPPALIRGELRRGVVILREDQAPKGARGAARLRIVSHDLGDLRVDLGPRDVAGVRRSDPGLAAHELLQRPVRDRVSVRKARRARRDLR